ncbi:competence pheromone ComX [Paenibacillus xanthanilyticus]|uniref:ComX pheromone n=1 Tax=Paenibacillus xanthanilyticus TaxID=1783531 RepID=A0ABV8JXE3_9BACL
MMLKEMIQAMVKDPGSLLRIQTGQLQLAGLSDTEHRALVDVLKGDGKEGFASLIAWK